ncbi:MAG TPA: hypothetical protein VKA89_04825 [Solirubrobacterales bacterium]|nr:hypothetical protein [Solirubrobacterales bacterium]
METIGFILALALSGLLIGALGRLLLPGRDPMSILETMLVGVAGSLIAGLIAYYAFDRNEGGGFLLSLLCTVGLVFAVRKFRQRYAPGEPAGPAMFGGGNVHTEVRFMPGCLLFSIVASILLTVLLNLMIRAF